MIMVAIQPGEASVMFVQKEESPKVTDLHLLETCRSVVRATIWSETRVPLSRMKREKMIERISAGSSIVCGGALLAAVSVGLGGVIGFGEATRVARINQSRVARLITCS